MSVSINLGEQNVYPFKVSPPRHSITRRWQSLTRLQKSMVYLIAAAIALLIIHTQGSTTPDSVTSDLTINERRVQTNEELNVDSDHNGHVISLLESNPGKADDQVDPHAVDYEKAHENRAVNADDAGVEDDPDGPHRMKFSGPSNSRQQAVVAAFHHSWKAYKKDAWGKDELHPLSHTYHTWFNLGLTLIDSLDTMYIMGLDEEFNEARDWVENSLNLNVGDVNTFETTIRVLGGLLSTYHLTGDQLFADKARELGDKLMPAFGSKTGIPLSDVNLGSGTAHGPRWGSDSSTSEASTIQLEFNDLSHITGDKKYMEASGKVRQILHDHDKKDGLVPIFINPNTGRLNGAATITLGARGDSYYEYLLKEWIQTGRSNDLLKDDYMEAMDGVERHLIKYSKPDNLLFVGELLSGRSFSPKMDHLVAFLAGTLALGSHFKLSDHHKEIAEKLMYTCYRMYKDMPTGLAPEIAHFSMSETSQADIIVKPADSHNLLRPETVESLFYLYWLTGDKKYQDWGWEIFENFERYSKIPEGGYCDLNSVKIKPPVCRDKMESFWLGETLKYFYLLFSDELYFPFDKWVFNTEAHPLPVIS